MLKEILLFILLGFLCFKTEAQNEVEDTVCLNLFSINGLTVGDDISKMYQILGKPASTTEIKSKEEEHSLPAQRIYSYGDLEIYEILYPEYRGKIGGFKLEKGLKKILYNSKETLNYEIRYKEIRLSDSLGVYKTIFPNSFGKSSNFKEIRTINFKVVNCNTDNSFISDVSISFKRGELWKVETVFYLE